MCETSCIIFGAKNLTQKEVEGRRIIEVGSYDENGSLRSIIELLNPAEYIGVDIQKGLGVDIVCSAYDIVKRFGQESFDIVISTELLEHVHDWRKAVSNIKNICKRNGIMLITSRSYGFRYHSYPYDCWRYELSDMEHIFADCVIEKLEKDRLHPGVFLKARKPKDFAEKDLSDYPLFSIVEDKRTKEVQEEKLKKFQKKYMRRKFIRKYVDKMVNFVCNTRKYQIP